MDLNRRRLFGLLPALPLASAAVPAVGALASPLKPFSVGYVRLPGDAPMKPLVAQIDRDAVVAAVREWKLARMVARIRIDLDHEWTDADVAATLGIPFDGEA